MWLRLLKGLIIAMVIVLVYFADRHFGYLWDKSKQLKVDWERAPSSSDLCGGTTVRLGLKQEYLFVGDKDDDVILGWDSKKEAVVVKYRIPNGGSRATCAASAVMVDKKNTYLEDIVVGRGDGVWLLTQTETGVFDQEQILISDSAPSAIALGDTNGNGYLDIFVSMGSESVLIMNLGKDDAGFVVSNDIQTDKFIWTACFVDLNHNGYPDLVCAVDDGAVEIFRNDGESWTKTEANPTRGSWRGITVGYLGDWPSLFITGDGENMLLKNKGNYQFDRCRKFVGGKGACCWGALFHDWNLDGKQDLLVSAGSESSLWNKYSWTRDPSVVYKNTGRRFEVSYKFKNNEISHSPIVIDIDGDGVDEIIWLNRFTSPTCYKPNVSPSGKTNVLNVVKSSVNANQIHNGKQLILGGTGMGIGETANISVLAE